MIEKQEYKIKEVGSKYQVLFQSVNQESFLSLSILLPRVDAEYLYQAVKYYNHNVKEE